MRHGHSRAPRLWGRGKKSNFSPCISPLPNCPLLVPATCGAPGLGEGEGIALHSSPPISFHFLPAHSSWTSYSSVRSQPKNLFSDFPVRSDLIIHSLLFLYETSQLTFWIFTTLWLIPTSPRRWLAPWECRSCLYHSQCVYQALTWVPGPSDAQ